MIQRVQLPALALVLLLALAAVPYVTSLGYEFVYDDHGSIAENPFLAHPANLWRVLTLRTFSLPYVLDGQRPVVLLTYFLDRALWGLAPAGHRATNLALHLLVVGLFWRWLRSLPLAPWTCWVAATLFAVHPVLTETVQMPAYREDLLALAFSLLYLHRARAAVQARGCLFSLCWFLLALLSKESAAAAPLLLAASLWVFPVPGPGRGARRAAVAAGLLLGLAFFALSFIQRPLQASGEAWNGISLRWPENLWTAPWLVVEYTQRMLWPWPLCADYRLEPVPSAADVRCWGGLLAIAVATSLSLLLRRRNPTVALGLSWFLLAYLPVSNLIPLFNPMAERYLYAVCPGLALVGAAILMLLPRGPALSVSALLVAAGLAVSTVRLRDFRSDATLWSATLQVDRAGHRGFGWLGLEAKARGDRATARAFFQQAELLNPHDVTAIINLAILDGEGGDLKSAESKLREAVRRNPRHALARWNLAVTLLIEGRIKEAEAEVQATLSIDPQHPEANRYLAR